MKNLFYLFVVVFFTLLTSCHDTVETKSEDSVSQTETRWRYDCTTQNISSDCVFLGLPPVTVSIPGYPGCSVTVQQDVYRCPDGFVFGETRMTGFNGACAQLIEDLNPGNYPGNESGWEKKYLEIKDALNLAAMQFHLSTFLPTGAIVPTVRLFAATCAKTCGKLVPGTFDIDPVFFDQYCGYGCCRKDYVYNKGVLSYIGATQLSPCESQNISCPPSHPYEIYPCMMKCN